ncbi:MAG: DUF1553 domain-containing protein [Planctomycetaceae bacterium]|nr:DUF1553 domain-containing protein [Planctomycetaceae bacterium]
MRFEHGVVLPGRSLAFMAMLLISMVGNLVAAESLAILPADFTLTGAGSQHRLLVQRMIDGEYSGEAAKVIFSSDNPDVVVIRNGVAVSMGDGTAQIKAVSGQLTTTTRVRVVKAGQVIPRSFRNHVLPVFAKSGCNSGSCHGALAGKGGFKLSLRGYDAATDHSTITRQARGRRIELSDPGRSLILAKPSGAIRHKGGLRFDVGSSNYQVVADWISSGALAPQADDTQLERLEILPPVSLLKPGKTQQMLVRAHYSDGRVEDVTHWAKYASANETVASIDDDGRVMIMGYGEGAVTAWFSQKIVIARFSAPHENKIADQVFVEATRHNFIDELVLKQLQRLRLRPSTLASDQEFLRRVFIDTIGTLPTVAETTGFLADEDPNKRDKLIDSLLERPEFVDYWTYKWSDVLLINGQKLRPPAVKAYYTWLREKVKGGTPWDQLVRDVVTSSGSSHENGATNFFALHQDPEGMSENVAQAFLGLSIGCAKCHNHPLEKWTNNQYYAMANMFSRVRAKGWGGDGRNGNGLRTLFVVPTGELVQPLTGKPQPPTPLDGQPLAFDDATDRRIALAAWLTAPDNPYFARSITNRVWANFMGVGLVETVDDMRVSNPATNEQLLAASARYLVEHQFDLKSLMRVIMQSATYQRSSMPLEQNQAEKRFYARYYPRRMMAEVLLDAISQVIDVPSTFNEIAFNGADKQKTDFYPRGTRAIQLYDSAVASNFLKTFGRNDRAITCECERSDEPSMIQVLHISNGSTINNKMKSKDSHVTKLAVSEKPFSEIIDDAYLRCLSRHPTDQEAKALLAMMQESKDDRRIAVEDLYWAVLSSREFLFNH